MKDTADTQARDPRPLRDVLTIRAFEQMLRARGAGRTEAKRAIHELRPETMRGMLPVWQRVAIAWRSRA